MLLSILTLSISQGAQEEGVSVVWVLVDFHSDSGLWSHTPLVLVLGSKESP